MHGRMKHNNQRRPITLTKCRFKSLSEDFMGHWEIAYRTLYRFCFYVGGPLHTLTNEQTSDKAGRFFSLAANSFHKGSAESLGSISVGSFILAISSEGRAPQGCDSSAGECRMAGRRRTPFFVAAPFLCNGSRPLFNFQRYRSSSGSGLDLVDIQ